MKKETLPALPREKAKGEDKVPEQGENLNKKAPIVLPATVKIPISLPPKDRSTVKSPNPVTQSPQKIALVNVNQNRMEGTGQPNSFKSLPARQEGKPFAGRASLPEVRLPSAPTSKGQTITSNRGSAGGFLGASPMRSFR